MDRVQSLQPDDPALPTGLMTATLDEPVTVQTGQVVGGMVRLHNHQNFLEAINGPVVARVLDPETGRPVGGFLRPVTGVGARYQVAGGASGCVQVLIGTQSLSPELGRNIPPGEWAFDALLNLRSGRYRLPPLPVTITV